MWLKVFVAKVFVCGFIWLYVVKSGFMWLYVVKSGFMWLYMVVYG